MTDPKITLIGFGEAGMAFRRGWGARRVWAYDIKSDDPAHGPAQLMAERYRSQDVIGADLVQALAGADLVFSLVTADQAVTAAGQVAAHLPQDALYFDCNSCAPDNKMQAARLIGPARYVDVAVMAPVHPKLHHVPLLVAGPEAAMTALQKLDMRATYVGAEIGAASTIKMLRSVMIKGFEALTGECFLAARRAGVLDQVLASLQASDPYLDWAARGGYNLERMMVHGQRRAAEMREVVATLQTLGLPSDMAMATVEWQERLGGMGGADGLIPRADAILAAL